MYNNWAESDYDRLADAFVNPPPYGFTKYEKEQMLNYIKNPSLFLKMPIKTKTEVSIFTYADKE